MLIEEFIARTGYTPSFEEYRNIEKQYSDFDGDKDAFCQKWRRDFAFGRLDAFDALSNLLVEECETNGLHTARFLAIKQVLIDYICQGNESLKGVLRNETIR